MQRAKNSLCRIMTMLMALCSAAVMAQDTAASKQDDKAAGGQSKEAEMMAAMMELAQPGENHKLLQELAGQWNYTVRFWMNPDTNAPPMESSGTVITKSAMGGRYFTSEHKGTMQVPGPNGAMTATEFHGMATEGYDNVKKKYVATWIDNMGTGIMYLEGDYDPGSKTLTYEAEYEPMPGAKIQVRETNRFHDRNHHTMQYFEKRGGNFVKVMEMEYIRSDKSTMRPQGVKSTTAD